MTRLHDWSVSRQRFWGAPVPMLCKELINKEEKLNELYRDNPDSLLLIHAWGSCSKSHWFPWVKEECKKMSMNVFDPDFPTPERPKIIEWWDTLDSEVNGEDFTNGVVVGRSLGAWLAIKFAENNRVRKLILTCPTFPIATVFKTWKKYAEDSDMYNDLVSFVSGKYGDVDLEKVKKNVGELVIMLSLNDPYIDVETTE